MPAEVIRVDPEGFDPEALAAPARCIRDGGLVVIPTETVYGIAVNLNRKASVRRLLEIRRSPEEKHVTLHIASRDDLFQHVARPLPAAAQRLMRTFWPGPLTIVFPARGEGTVGVRYPNHPVAVEIIRQAGVPVGAPSANRSGGGPALDGETAAREFANEVDFVVDAGPTRYGKASTVVRVLEGMEILREGAIPEGVVREAEGRVILFVCTGNTCRSPMAEALFKSMLAKRLGVAVDKLEEAGYRVLSAGTAAGTGVPASAHGVEVVEKMGGDLTQHGSRPVTVTMLEEADRIYVMTESHRDVLGKWMPDCLEKIYLLDPDNGDIEDPIGGDLLTYRKCAERIRSCVERRVAEVVEK